MRIMEVIYNADLGEAMVIYNKDFLTMHHVIQLDCLQDAIYELEEMYNSMLEKKEEA